MKKAKRAAVYTVKLMALPVFLLGGIELALRLFLGMPEGQFCALFPGPNGLYPPNRRMVVDFGVVPYVVETNSLGFRGPEISVQKPPGVFRIAALGDSMTDGFFVDNDATFPYLLQQNLEAGGWTVEVVNAAHGGGTIDTQYAMLEAHVLPLDPDLVILTWTPNDIGDLMTGTPTQMPGQGFTSGPRAALGWLACHSAISEGLLDVYFRSLSDKYRWLTRQSGEIILDDRRYQVPGSTDFARNAQYTLAGDAEADGQILVEPFTPATEAAIQTYLEWLGRMERVLRERGIRFVFVYLPAYSQVYLPGSSMRIRDILRDECARLEVPFLDLTPVFQERGQERALDMAPLDYHLSPYGNQVVADALADFLSAK
ncbi:MAG: SGNH/GDSL hydrolase family protein [Anaerolineae bacterium]